MSRKKIVWNSAQAERLARFAHAGQTDKAGEDYFDAHVADVVMLLKWGSKESNQRFRALSTNQQELAVMAAYLHDVAEDTAVSTNMLMDLGCPVWHEVYHLTRPDPRSYWGDLTARNRQREQQAYYDTIKADPVLLAVKEADINSNTHPRRVFALRKVDPAAADRLAAKYAKAREALALEDPWS